MDDGSFLRQRRNVFVVCSVLWVLCLGGVDLQELTFAGMKFGSFKKPEVFLYGVWVAFAYFSYRFLVYFMEGSRQEVSRLYLREMERVVAPRLRDVIRKKYPTATRPATYEIFRKNRPTYLGQWEEEGDDHGHKFTQIHSFSLPIRRRMTAWWELRGFLRFAFLTPALTEHVLPLAISVGTLFYCGFMAGWQGNLLGL